MFSRYLKETQVGLAGLVGLEGLVVSCESGCDGGSIGFGGDVG